MIETIVLNALNAVLPVEAFMEDPKNKPASYVVLEKTGSNRENRLDTATFAAKSIAPSLEEAAALNEAVKAALDQLPYTAEHIFAAKLNSDYNFTDTRTKQRRYQAVYNITYKEE